MSKRATESAVDSIAEADAIQAPADPFGGVVFESPLLKLVQASLGPFLQHREPCTGDTCACGLHAAVQDLGRREMLVRRYGFDD